MLAQAPGWLGAALVTMAAATALLAWLQPRERHVLYLSAMMVCWPLLRGAMAWPALQVLALALLTLCAAQYLLRPRPDWAQRKVLPVLVLQCVLAPASLLAETNQRGLLLASWELLLNLELVAAMAIHLQLRRRAMRALELPDPMLTRDFAIHAALMGLAGAALLAEQLMRLTGGTAPFWFALALPLLMLGLGLHVIAQIVRALHEAEGRHEQLEQRMHERVADIERSFNAMAEQKLEQVTERERKRIAADLHDDLGAKLLTIVHTSESDRISTLAREALEEMRLSVRGLTGKPVQLLDALGDWRAEVVSRLGQANILAEWKSPSEDIIHTLQARAYVQTTRILRESVSNIIKHSGATHCTVSCSAHDGDFMVVIQDNGQGIPSELDGRLDRGHGMASMKARAKQMHGQCLVESGPGWGTVIRLTIPL